MMPESPRRRRGRTVVETTVAIIILGVLVGILMPVLSIAVERSLAATCRSNLDFLYESVTLYCSDCKYMPSSQLPDGPFWFDKLESQKLTGEGATWEEKFRCPRAPDSQQGFRRATRGETNETRAEQRDTVSFGWNELDVAWKTVKASDPASERHKMLLGDSWLPASPTADERVDTLLTRGGELRLDYRHQGAGQVLFLDGHVEALRPDAAVERASWKRATPTITLGEQRPARDIQGPLESLEWWQWMLIALGIGGPYFMTFGGVQYVRRLRARHREKERQKAEEAERQAEAEEQEKHEAERREYLKRVPSGPLGEVSLPRAVLHVGKRRFLLQPTREIVIGRGEHVGVRIRNNENVSREHAKIRPEPRGYVIYDLYSRTGTFIGGKRTQAKVLADGDRVRIGRDVEVTFEIERS